MNSAERGHQNKQEGKKVKRNHSLWTSKEIATLKELYPDNNNFELSKLLNKTKASIDQKASLLGLKKSPSYRQQVSRLNNKSKRHAWTEQDIVFLQENYKKLSYQEIADSLRRTASAVSQKARQLKLKKYNRDGYSS